MAARVTSPVFVGRERELADILSAVDRSRQGEGTFLLVTGEAGVGKSRLVEEAAAMVRRAGSFALIGRCVQLGDSGAPYAPIRQALRDLSRAMTEEQFEALVASSGADAAPLISANEPAGTGSRAVAAMGLDTTQARMFEATVDLLSSASRERGLALIVEDIHWADRSTLDLLTYIVRARADLPFASLATFRSDELHRGHRLRPVLAEFQRATRSVRIDIPPFDREELERQLAAILGRPPNAALAERVYTRSDGNAFFAEEILAAEATGDKLPQGLREVVLSRVAQLTDDTEDILKTLSVGGVRVASRVLERVTGRSTDELEPGLRDAVQHYFLVPDEEDGTEYIAFRHALVQEAVYGELLPGERIRLHTRFADALAAAPGTGTAAELAYHRFAAHDMPRALEASVVAGGAAERTNAFAVAEREYTRALEIWESVPDAAQRTHVDRVELLERAARATAVSNPPRAVALIGEALAICDAADGTRVGLLKERFGTYSYFAGDGFAALDACREAVESVASEPPTTARAQVLASLGRMLMIFVQWEEASRVCEEAIECAHAVGATELECHAMVSLGAITAYLGRLEAGIEQLERAIGLATDASMVEAAARGHSNLIDVLTQAGRFRAAGDATLPSFAFAEQSGLARVIGVIELADGALALYRLGAWREAREFLDRARRYDLAGIPHTYVEERLAMIEVGQGDHEAAAARIAAVRPLIERAVEAQLITPLTEAAAELALWQGRPDQARREVAAAVDRLPIGELGYISRIGPVLALGVRAEADAGTGREARRHDLDHVAMNPTAIRYLEAMESLREAARERGHYFADQAHAWLSLCRAEQGRLEGRSSPIAWAFVADSFSSIPIPYQRAYGLWRQAEAELAGSRSRLRAAEPLRAAHAIAVELGAEPLRGAIAALATAAHIDLGVAIAPAIEQVASTREDRSGLTSREVEVLRLIASGQTNREIAQRLFITEGTAGTHVSNIIGKLGVRTRTEAAAVAYRLGLTEISTDAMQPRPT